jgi:nitrogenase molybdenum-iron protein beta chain
VRKFAGFNSPHAKRKTEKFIAGEETQYYKYLEDFTDFYAEYWWGLPAKFAVIGDSTYNLALTKFLVNQLGLIPGRQIITDNPPEEFREGIRAEYHNIADDVETDVDFEEEPLQELWWVMKRNRGPRRRRPMISTAASTVVAVAYITRSNARPY